MRSAAPQPDLLAWPIVRQHADAMAAAESRLQEARRRFRCAPRGQVRLREEALQEATRAALAAELAYQQVVQEAAH